MKKIISLFLLGLVMVFFLKMAEADDVDDLIDVVFEHPVLFSNVKIMPGDRFARWFEVTSITDDTLDIYLKTTNEKDFDNLSGQIKATIRKGNEIKYQGSLSDLFNQDPHHPVLLYELKGRNTALFDFEIYFDFTTDNDYQGKSVGFDILIQAETR